MPSISEMISQRNSPQKKRKKRRQRRVKYFNNTPIKHPKKPHVHSTIDFDTSINDKKHYFPNIVIPNKVKMSGWYIDQNGPLTQLLPFSTPRGEVYVFKNPKYGDKNFKIGNLRVLNDDGDIVNHFYPIAERFTDIYNIGYCITGTASGISKVYTNSWESFWDTRRGRRYDKYVEYLERRDRKKLEYKKKESESSNKM